LQKNEQIFAFFVGLDSLIYKQPSGFGKLMQIFVASAVSFVRWWKVQ
jgi:hypothetical protein